MNYNYETTQIIMEGADLLYSMLQELNVGIRHLPGCKMTAGLKSLSANICAASSGIYQTMRNISAEAPCEECVAEYDEYREEDIPNGADLQEFLDAIGDMLASGKPISISADIYINEEKDGDAESIDVESEEL